MAQAHGALVRYEPRPGKGNVIRRAFADVEADVYVLLDGDDTYDASVAGELVQKLISEGLDHVVGARRASTVTAYRRGHAAGNKMLNQVVSTVFGEPVTDMLSGYRSPTVAGVAAGLAGFGYRCRHTRTSSPSFCLRNSVHRNS